MGRPLHNLTSSGDHDALRSFLGTVATQEECVLYLPQFRGNVQLESDDAQSALRYPGTTFTDHDARAAFYVGSIISRILDTERIEFRQATAFNSNQGLTHPAFLFGSRSNAVTRWVLDNRAPRFVRFEFGDIWRIRCQNQDVFEVPDPSKLDQASYGTITDYGVIERFSDPVTSLHTFVIAGLGSRATEGCGYFVSRYWPTLLQSFGNQDFAVVLEFPPPVDPTRSRQIRSFTDSGRFG